MCAARVGVLVAWRPRLLPGTRLLCAAVVAGLARASAAADGGAAAPVGRGGGGGAARRLCVAAARGHGGERVCQRGMRHAAGLGRPHAGPAATLPREDRPAGGGRVGRRLGTSWAGQQAGRCSPQREQQRPRGQARPHATGLQPAARAGGAVRGGARGAGGGAGADRCRRPRVCRGAHDQGGPRGLVAASCLSRLQPTPTVCLRRSLPACQPARRPVSSCAVLPVEQARALRLLQRHPCPPAPCCSHNRCSSCTPTLGFMTLRCGWLAHPRPLWAQPACASAARLLWHGRPLRRRGWQRCARQRPGECVCLCVNSSPPPPFCCVSEHVCGCGCGRVVGCTLAVRCCSCDLPPGQHGILVG